MAAGSKERRNPPTCLSDDLIVEILSRLPVKSVCRFKCVSKRWRGLISHPDYRKKLPQTLAGFFYRTLHRERFGVTVRHFTNVTGSGAPLISPSLAFLPGHADMALLDSCNGLLLCRNRILAESANHYVVCNPATEQWVALPLPKSFDICAVRLGFDPAVSQNFNVFELVEARDGYVPELVEADGYGPFIDGLEIYSSETGQWAHRDSGWSADATWWDGTMADMHTVFLNGFLHLFAPGYKCVPAVDTKGSSWRTIPVPDGDGDGFIGHSQGHLYYLNTVEEQLSVFVLEDYASDEWIFKHSLMISELLGMSRFCPLQNLITIHPECHLIFFVSDLDHTIRCYDMDSRKVRVIQSMGLGRYFQQRWLSYVPLFSESLTAWN